MTWDWITIFFLFLFEKYITKKNQIIIFDSCASWMKVNLEVANASSNLWTILVMSIKYWLFFTFFYKCIGFILLVINVLHYLKNLVIQQIIHKFFEYS